MIDLYECIDVIETFKHNNIEYRIVEKSIAFGLDEIRTDYVYSYDVEVKHKVLGIFTTWVKIKTLPIKDICDEEDMKFQLNEARECVHHIINPYGNEF